MLAIDIPLGNISKVEKVGSLNKQKQDVYGLEIICKVSFLNKLFSIQLIKYLFVKKYNIPLLF